VALLGCSAVEHVYVLANQTSSYRQRVWSHAQCPAALRGVCSLTACRTQHSPHCAGEQKHSTEPAGPATGIIKANWFAKHRQRRPAVAAVFLDREAAAGDPSAWSRACAALEAVRAAVKPCGARIVVAVVQVNEILVEGCCHSELHADDWHWGLQLWSGGVPMISAETGGAACYCCETLGLFIAVVVSFVVVNWVSQTLRTHRPSAAAALQDVQAPLGSDLPDERVAMLARQAGIDRK
jgi:hypothetical protein